MAKSVQERAQKIANDFFMSYDTFILDQMELFHTDLSDPDWERLEEVAMDIIQSRIIEE